jgi:hypothetical protein
MMLLSGSVIISVSTKESPMRSQLGTFDRETGQINLPVRETQQARYELIRDHSDRWRFATILAIVFAILFAGWWTVSTVIDEKNWAGCEAKGRVLCPEFARADRVDAKEIRTAAAKQASDANTLALAKIAAEERTAADSRLQAAMLEAARLARETTIVQPQMGGTQIVGGPQQVAAAPRYWSMPGVGAPRTVNPGCRQGFHPAPPPPGHSAWCEKDI